MHSAPDLISYVIADRVADRGHANRESPLWTTIPSGKPLFSTASLLALPERRPQRRVDAIGRLFLHAGDQVAVRVEGDADGRVPEALADNLRVNVLTEELSRVGVTQTVQPHLREVQVVEHAAESAAETGRAAGLSIPTRTNEILVLVRGSGLQAQPRLLLVRVPPQGSENIEDGARINEFLEWFPGVTRVQVEAVLQHAEQSLKVA
jgi:hypothetical protein